MTDICIVCLDTIKRSNNTILCDHCDNWIPIKGSSIKYVRKIFRKTNISKPLIRTGTCAYQGVRNVIFSENFAYILNGWTLNAIIRINLTMKC